MQKPERFKIIVSLLILYVIWSTTYIAIKEAVRVIPPMLMTGSRYVVPGAILFIIMIFSGRKLPGFKEWRGAFAAGSFLIAGGTFFLAAAQQWVGSGISSIAIAAVPIWTSVISSLTGRKSTRMEVIGLVIGFSGLILLNYERSMQANTMGAICLMLSPLLWAIGSVLTKKTRQAPGLMGSALQMLCGGIVAMILGLLIGERLTTLPTTISLLSWGYLAIVSGLIAYPAYMYLFTHTSPALATSYAYVNPVLAMIIGVFIAREVVTPAAWLSMIIVVTGVVFVVAGYARKEH